MKLDKEFYSWLHKGRKNYNNWYADELLEVVTHIQQHAENKDISIVQYLNMLDGVIRRATKIKESLEKTEFDDFNADDYTSNEFEKYGNQKRFSKSEIIKKYLGTMNKQDIHTLCSKFGKDRVVKELNYKFKELFELDYIDIEDVKVPLKGKNYKENEVFLKILKIIESYEEAK